MKSPENLLDHLGYHPKWHGSVQRWRTKTKYSINEPLIKEIFKRLNIPKGYFLEFGAWDGIELSNTKVLEEEGWEGILIESHPARFSQLVNNFKHNPNIACLNKFINTDSTLLDDILKEQNCKHLDFCSIDIDGLDLEIFDSLKTINPTVVCIEGGQALHPFHPKISTQIARNNISQSLSTFVDLFEKRGYFLLCCYQDCFFVKKEHKHLFTPPLNILQQYINGLLALPRIPYLKKLLNENGLTNSILDNAIEATAPVIGKTAWVEQNYTPLTRHLNGQM